MNDVGHLLATVIILWLPLIYTNVFTASDEAWKALDQVQSQEGILCADYTTLTTSAYV